MGFESRVELRGRFYFRTTGGVERGRSLLAGVCRRFLCFGSFSPLEKEMKGRPAQGLIVLSKKLRHGTRESASRTARAWKAPTARHDTATKCRPAQGPTVPSKKPPTWTPAQWPIKTAPTP